MLITGTSLVVQWLKLHLPMQGVWVQSLGGIPIQGTKIPHASWPKKPKQKQHCNKFNKDFKNGPHQKNKCLSLKNNGGQVILFYRTHYKLNL